ncbi:cytochrome c [Actibacterium sp. MT2.3-13A]|uniref:cytochrome c n=1 Tax=Actibacterium sp. MT2.3-13A TaxID=2828332 RepID=UPI001BA46823|nr:cytochrome c [Actibacterium sp. MT2.3-13A]
MKPVIIAGAAGLVAAGVAYVLIRGGAEEATAPAGGQGPAPGAAIVTVQMPALSATAQLGRKAFEANCATCHGPDGSGRQDSGPPLIHKIYEPGHHADIAIVMAAQRGVKSHHWRFGDMAPVPGLTERELGSIVVYIREVQRANGIE